MIFNKITKNHFLICAFLLISQGAFSQQKTLAEIDLLKDNSLAVKALFQYKKEKKNRSKQDDLDIYERLGSRYVNLLKLDSSHIHINQAIELAKQLKKDSSLCNLYKLKGLDFYYLNRPKDALKNWETALRIAEKNKYDELSAIIYNNIGAVYVEKKQFKEAEKYLLKALTLNKKLKQEMLSRNRFTLRILGTNYADQNKHEKAIPIFEELIEQCEIAKDSAALSSVLTFYALSLSKSGQKKKAYSSMKEALMLQQKAGDIQGVISIHEFYARILNQNGDFKDAYKKMNEAYLLKDDLFQKQMADATADAEVKYKTDSITQQKEITELQNKQSKQALQLSENKRAKMFLFIIITVILAVALFLIYFFYQQKQKGEQLLRALVEGEEKERERIATDLHDGIVQSLTAFKQRLNNLKTQTLELHEQKIEELNADIGKIADEVRELSYQMMPITLRELGLTQALHDLLRKNCAANNISYSFETQGITDRFPQNIETTVFRIMQELINNTIKHSQATHVSLFLQLRNNMLQLTYEDNGIGFDTENIKKGIGMNSIKNRMELVKGSLEIISSKENGMAVYMRVANTSFTTKKR